jgi:hypothetical protein
MRILFKSKCRLCREYVLTETQPEQDSLCLNCRSAQEEQKRIYDTDKGLGQCHYCGSRNLTAVDKEAPNMTASVVAAIGMVLEAFWRLHILIGFLGIAIVILSLFLPDYTKVSVILCCEACGHRREI